MKFEKAEIAKYVPGRDIEEEKVPEVSFKPKLKIIQTSCSGISELNYKSTDIVDPKSVIEFYCHTSTLRLFYKDIEGFSLFAAQWEVLMRHLSNINDLRKSKQDLILTPTSDLYRFYAGELKFLLE
jgi:hypothetical protein